MRRAVTPLVLICVLAFTSVEAAIARGLPAPAGEVVLCRGLAVVTVTLDENGDPVRRSQLCPEALGALLDLAAEARAQVAPGPVIRSVHRAERGVSLRSAELPPCRARGPPSLS
ncbi:hypothetical protein ROJ8625_02396 [Roseivivax jejudonensis]|uniref:Uncharacterized protein n=1 Tax=Roseivivax jejudonensis TaxID=1529041 RepID=A0A1X6ZG62_9RHOB|nr:hypothetical protein [Roseivivax jejudonensis]SLN48879.1 hypothetical protein ROJ8625_02396 [Roseivivax jejudonensis]